MGEFVNSRSVASLSWVVTVLIGFLNVWLLVETFRG